jgi:hypothetical protein
MSHLIPIKEDVYMGSVLRKVATLWLQTQMVLSPEFNLKFPKPTDHISSPQAHGWPYAPPLVMARIF